MLASKAKEALLPHEVRLTWLGTNPVLQCRGDIGDIAVYADDTTLCYKCD